MSTKRILFVDDTFSPHVWQSTMVDICKNADEAIELINTNNYEMISLDYDMPGLTGLGLLQSCDVNWNKKQIPFINIHSSHPYAHKMVEHIKNCFNYRCIVFMVSKQSLPDCKELQLLLGLAVRKFGEDISKWKSDEYKERDYIELRREKLTYRVRKHYSEKINVVNGKSSIINIKNPKDQIERLLSAGYEIVFNPFGNLDCCMVDVRFNVHNISQVVDKVV